MIEIIVPALAESLQAISRHDVAALPLIKRVAARGTHHAESFKSLEEIICLRYGIKRQNDFPLAAICRETECRDAGTACWMRADPVHVRIQRDRLVLDAHLEISKAEAQALSQSFASHFGNEFAPSWLESSRWYLRLDKTPDMTTTPLSQAQGQDIQALMPSGPDALHWRKLMNEVQMLLFDHPVNQAREQLGKPAINSIWLWGIGTLPRQSTLTGELQPPEFYGDDFLAAAIAAQSGASVFSAANSAVQKPAIVLFEDIRNARDSGDFQAWVSSLETFDSGWMQTLLKSGKRFTLHDPASGYSLSWKPMDRWKFWRRQQINPEDEQERAFKLAGPRPSLTGEDEFGNRF